MVCVSSSSIEFWHNLNDAEHIWWDQASALMQVGALPSHVPYPSPDGKQVLRLPVAGAESARMLANETDGKSNEMFGKDWGVSGTA